MSLTDKLPTILIHYEGRDADRHEIDMKDLADSLQGLSRIVGIAVNFAATQKYVQHKDALEVRVLVRPPEPGSFDIVAVATWLDQHSFAGAVVSGLSVALIAYIFKKAAGDRAEMKELRAALEVAIHELGTKDVPVVERLLSTIDKMADSLRPAAKLAVSPIGRTATKMQIGVSADARAVTLDEADRDAISSELPTEVSPERDYVISISELDMQSGGCKFTFDSEPSLRIAGLVTDPAVYTPNNAYALSMAERRPLVVRAKAATRDGEIEKLYISDCQS